MCEFCCKINVNMFISAHEIEHNLMPYYCFYSYMFICLGNSMQYQGNFRNIVKILVFHLCLISRRVKSSTLQLNTPAVGSDTGSADSMP